MSHSSIHPSVSLFLSGLLLVVAGCSSQEYAGPKRYGVSGSVTFDGTPVQTGMINFVSQGEGRSASGAIENGRYIIEENQGPTVGNYKVEVYGYETVGTSEDPDVSPTQKEIVPKNYNKETNLTAEVVADGDNTFDFTLTK